MSRVKYENFEKGETREQNVFEVNLGKILLVEDIKVGGYTAFFKPIEDMKADGTTFFKSDPGIITDGETKESAVMNLLNTFNTVLNSGSIKLNIKKLKI